MCVCVCDERGLWWFPSVPSKTTTQRPHYVAEWMEERVGKEKVGEGEKEARKQTGERKRETSKE